VLEIVKDSGRDAALHQPQPYPQTKHFPGLV
jgi:hypothetical protein